MSFNEERYELFLKIKNNSTEDAIKILQNSRLVNINSPLNNFDWTPLHLAAYQGNVELVKFLLQEGADAMVLNRSGYTPLMLAESKSCDDVMKMLADSSISSSA